MMLSGSSRAGHLLSALCYRAAGSVRASSSQASGAETFQAKANLPDFLASRRLAYPDKDLLRVCDQKLHQTTLQMTWNEVQRVTDALACGLLDSRVRYGDSGLLLLPSSSENFVSFVALGKIGARSVQLPESASDELIKTALASGVRTAIIHPTSSEATPTNRIRQFQQIIPELQGEYATPQWPADYPSLKTVVQTGFDVVPGMLSIEDLFSYDVFPDPLPAYAARLSAGQDVLATHYVGDALLPFTHAAVCNSAASISRRWGLTPDDRVMTAIHLDRGQTGQVVLLSIFAARAVALVSSADQSAAGLVKNLAAETVSHLVVRPAQLAGVLAAADFRPPAALKHLLVVAAPDDLLSPALAQQAAQALPGVAITTAFSHPAVPGFFLQSAPGQPVLAADGRVSYGQPSENTSLRIVDASGAVCSRGQPGQIQLGGPVLSTLHQGSWLSTGVQATMLPDASVCL